MTKIVRVLIVLIALGLTSVSAYAGLFDDVISGAAERLGNRAVNEAADSAYDGAKNAVTNAGDDSEKPAPKKKTKQSRPVVESDEEPAPVEKTKPAKATAPASGDSAVSEAVYSKYDFIPGDKVIFYDDFSDTDVGEFPRKWTLNGPKNTWNNAVEVVESGGRRFLRSTPAQEETGQMGATQYIRLKNKGDLPKKFTIEFDAILGGGGEDMIQFFLLMTSGENWPVSAVADVGSIQITSEIGQSKNTETAIRMNDGRLHHVAVSVNGTFVKAYVDNVRVVNDPDAIQRPIERIGVFMGPYGGRRMENIMFTNFRLAEGGKDIRSALDTDGRIVTHGILFDTGSDRIKPESQPTLKMILALLEDDPALNFSIEGHTDNQGGKGINQPLSEKRSAAVKKWLTGKGIDTGRLTSKGFGDSKPIDVNNTVEGRANNRRVEFVKI